MPPAHQPLNNPAKIAVIGSYLPRRCGIATFSADLLASMKSAAPDTELWSVAMNDIPVGYDYPSEVQFEIGQRIVGDYRSAVDFLNMNGVDAVSLQHEFGIYGGKAGNNVVRLLAEPAHAGRHHPPHHPRGARQGPGAGHPRHRQPVGSDRGDEQARRPDPAQGLWRRAGPDCDHSAWRARHALPRFLVSQGGVRHDRQEGDPHLRPHVARQGLRIRHRGAAEDRAGAPGCGLRRHRRDPSCASSARRANPTGTRSRRAPRSWASASMSSSTTRSSTSRRSPTS